MKPSAKDRLVETALTLFERDGFHATGIDKILAAANVSKMTMYKHFPSKDALILEVLAVRDHRFRTWLDDRVQALADTPQGRLVAVFDALAEWFEQPDFHGCLFINATAEYGAETDMIHISAQQYKRRMVQWLADHAREAEMPDPQAMAWILMLLMEGAIVTAQASGEKRAAKYAKVLAIRVVNGAAGTLSPDAA